MANYIFIGYYNLIRLKWTTEQSLNWIFFGKSKGKRYYECCFWNNRWRKLFIEHGLKANLKTLRDFFSFQNFRFYKSKYHPSVSSLFSTRSIEMFKIFYTKKDFNKLIYQVTLRKVFRRWHEKMEKGEIGLDLCINYTGNDTDRLRFKKRTGSFKNILIYFCSLNDLFYDKNSSICKSCRYKERCRTRDLPY